MNKHFLRLIAVILVPALLVDALSGSAMAVSVCPQTRMSRTAPAFENQALQAAVLSMPVGRVAALRDRMTDAARTTFGFFRRIPMVVRFPVLGIVGSVLAQAAHLGSDARGKFVVFDPGDGAIRALKVLRPEIRAAMSSEAFQSHSYVGNFTEAMSNLRPSGVPYAEDKIYLDQIVPPQTPPTSVAPLAPAHFVPADPAIPHVSHTVLGLSVHAWEIILVVAAMALVSALVLVMVHRWRERHERSRVAAENIPATPSVDPRQASPVQPLSWEEKLTAMEKTQDDLSLSVGGLEDLAGRLNAWSTLYWDAMIKAGAKPSRDLMKKCADLLASVTVRVNLLKDNAFVPLIAPQAPSAPLTPGPLPKKASGGGFLNIADDAGITVFSSLLGGLMFLAVAGFYAVLGSSNPFLPSTITAMGGALGLWSLALAAHHGFMHRGRKEVLTDRAQAQLQRDFLVNSRATLLMALPLFFFAVVGGVWSFGRYEILLALAKIILGSVAVSALLAPMAYFFIELFAALSPRLDGIKRRVRSFQIPGPPDWLLYPLMGLAVFSVAGFILLVFGVAGVGILGFLGLLGFVYRQDLSRFSGQELVSSLDRGKGRSRPPASRVSQEAA
jgi:hypothetical protein